MCSASVMNALKITFMALAAVTLLSALVLNVLAGAFPNWMEVDIVIDNQRHSRGLWMYCVGPIDTTNPTGDATRCYPKSSSDDINAVAPATLAQARGKSPDLKPFERTVLILIIVSFIIGLLTLFVSFCGFCNKWFTLAWRAGALISTATSIASVVVFFLNAYEDEYRRVQSDTRSQFYWQELGFAFWCMLAAAAMYILTLVIATIATILSFAHSRNEDVRNMNGWPAKQQTVV